MRAGMPVSVRYCIAVLLVTAAAAAGPASAQSSGQGPLAMAEQAYLRVDFEATLEHARAALEAGGHSRDRLVRIYQLMGIAAAALEREEESREAYVRMLALDPERDVDRNLAPRLRSPFLEARGYWTARSERLGVEVTLDRARGGLVVQLADPLDMAQAVVVHARAAGHTAWRDSRQPAVASQLVPVQGARGAPGVEYAIEVLDAHGNHLVELGTTASPRLLGEAALADADEGTDGDDGSLFASPVFWAIAGALLVGGGIAVFVLASDQAVGAQTTVSFGLQ